MGTKRKYRLKYASSHFNTSRPCRNKIQHSPALLYYSTAESMIRQSGQLSQTISAITQPLVTCSLINVFVKWFRARKRNPRTRETGQPFRQSDLRATSFWTVMPYKNWRHGWHFRVSVAQLNDGGLLNERYHRARLALVHNESFNNTDRATRYLLLRYSGKTALVKW